MDKLQTGGLYIDKTTGDLVIWIKTLAETEVYVEREHCISLGTQDGLKIGAILHFSSYHFLKDYESLSTFIKTNTTQED